MALEIQQDLVPLRTDPGGVVRVGRTRVPLETVVGAYLARETAEEIVVNFETLSLADVHATIAYYLRHKDAVDAYIQNQEERATAARERAESRYDRAALRARLIARQAGNSAPEHCTCCASRLTRTSTGESSARS
jgi:uncharacterized protein (DUF433 family)